MESQFHERALKGRKLLFKDSSLSFARMIVSTLVNYVLLMLVVKGVGSSGYGTITQLSVTSLIIVTIVSLNVGHSMSRFLAGDQDKKAISRAFSAVLSLVILTSSLVSIGVFISGRALNPLVFGADYEEWLWLALVAFYLCSSIQIQIEALLRARRFIKSLFIVDIIISVITITAYLFVLAFWKSLFTLAWTMVLIAGVKTLMFFAVFYLKGYRLCRPTFGVLKSYIAFGAPLLFMGFGFMIVQYAGRYVINLYHGIASVGAYCILYAFSNLIIFFWNAGNSVFLPDLSNLYDKGEKEEVEYRFGKVFNFGLSIMIPAVLGLIAIKDQLFLLLGDRLLIAEGNSFQVLCLAFCCYGIILAFSLLINLLKKSILLGTVWLILAIINIILNLLLVPHYGIMGCAIGALVSFFVGCTALFLESRRYFIIHLFPWKVLKIGIAALAMFAVVRVTSFHGMAGLIIEISLGAFVYCIILLAAGFFEKSEVYYIAASLKRTMKSALRLGIVRT